MAAALRALGRPGDTAPAAASAWGDIIKTVFISLVAQIWIRKQRPSYGYAVHDSPLYDICRVPDIVDLPYRIDGNADHFLDLSRLIDVHADAFALAWYDVFQPFILRPSGHFQQVHASLLELRCQIEHILQGVPSLCPFIS